MRTHGFTLIELLAVLLITVVLAALGIPVTRSIIRRAQEAHVVYELDQFATQIQMYRVEQGTYPADTLPGIKPDGVEEWPRPGAVTLSSVLDYEHWGLGNGNCVVYLTHFGWDATRQSPVYQAYEPVGAIIRVGDDFVKVINQYDCDLNRAGPVR